jgi:hypothetical protein
MPQCVCASVSHWRNKCALKSSYVACRLDVAHGLVFKQESESRKIYKVIGLNDDKEVLISFSLKFFNTYI